MDINIKKKIINKKSNILIISGNENATLLAIASLINNHQNKGTSGVFNE